MVQRIQIRYLSKNYLQMKMHSIIVLMIFVSSFVVSSHSKSAVVGNVSNAACPEEITVNQVGYRIKDQKDFRIGRIACPVNIKKAPIVENKNIFLLFNDDLNGIKSLIDKSTNRQLASGVSTSIYSIGYRDKDNSLKIVDSKSADRYSYKKSDNGLELYYWHETGVNLKVTCKVRSNRNDSLIHWSIEIENYSNKTLCTVEYPKISCAESLGEMKDDAIVYPVHEGVLLTGMNKKGTQMFQRYPGPVSAQFMYYFDPSGGFYYASYDGEGYPKNIKVSNNGEGIVLSQEYLLPVQFESAIKMPYEVVTGCFGGRWEDGASVYRKWSDRQVWTEKTINQRKSPFWLKEPNLFINAGFGSKYKDVESADRMIKGYHDYFDIPVITAVFRWEKHGDWIGPDYFPPNPNKEFYVDLVKRLEKRGDHLYFYTSGFRWGVRKPINNPKKDQPRIYTNWDGTSEFMEKGKDFATTDYKNELVPLKVPWADNYILCTGSGEAQDILDSCYNYIFDLGVAGVDLDQNIGGEVADCYNASHGHPRGSGLWQTQAMERFFSRICSENEARKIAFFQGTEEPCEKYIPYLDEFHGRSFTSTVWPAVGPGAVSIPLYIFLYHQYQIGYAGWIDGGFSPSGYEKYGIGRSFIFGMYPGVRVNGKMELKGDNPSDELKILKGYVHLTKESPDFLLHGRMIGETQIEGSEIFNQNKGRGDKIPVKWNAVQGISWISEYGDKVGYAITNLSEKSQTVQIKLVKDMERLFKLSGYVLDKSQNQNGLRPVNGWLTITLQPWELAIVERDSILGFNENKKTENSWKMYPNQTTGQLSFSEILYDIDVFNLYGKCIIPKIKSANKY